MMIAPTPKRGSAIDLTRNSSDSTASTVRGYSTQNSVNHIMPRTRYPGSSTSTLRNSHTSQDTIMPIRGAPEWNPARTVGYSHNTEADTILSPSARPNVADTDYDSRPPARWQIPVTSRPRRDSHGRYIETNNANTDKRN